jgi:hypothetical protein
MAVRKLSWTSYGWSHHKYQERTALVDRLGYSIVVSVKEELVHNQNILTKAE